ncbi:hypothetical protein [Acinetobacter sp. YH01026]|uniref:hypothetical protein n=1 Tax=Acinetobacter sp. YH01026 TaxID=2601039 RepID=UPI0015D15DA3|nr:hypothetical protein [Acinetobacter sp. YH01026]
MENTELDLCNLDQHIQESFDGIKLLELNSYFKQALSCAFILIDQMSWLVSGEEIYGNVYFKKWVNMYLTKHYPKISAEELWAYRNGLIHNNSTISRDITKGKVSKQLYFYNGLSTLEALDAYYDDNDDYHIVNTAKFLQITLVCAVKEFRQDLANLSIQEQSGVKEKLRKILQPLYLDK